MLLLTIIFLILSVLVLLDFIDTRYKEVVFILTALFLFSIAAFRPSTVDRDYLSYIRLFNHDLKLGEAFIEPTFILLSNFIHRYLFAQPIFLFIIYALVAVSGKFIAIRQLSEFWFLSILIYFSYSYILHDVTQIRAGVSVGFVLLSIKPLYQRQAIRFFLFGLLAILFHYSALVILLIWFFNAEKINALLYASFIVIAYLVFFTSNFFITNITSYLPEGILLSKISSYEPETGAKLNVFNSWQIMRCLLCFLFLWKIDTIQLYNQYAILLLKIYVTATVTFVLLASNPTFATRISDLFSIVDIVMIPCLVYLFKPRIVGVIMVICIGALYLVLNLYYNKIIY